MSAGHVLVARLDNVGDVLLAGPALRAVAAGADRVTVLASRRGAAAAELLPGVDAVVEFEAPWILADPEPVDPAAVHDLVERVAGLGVDAAVVLTSFHQSPLPLALLLRLAGVAHVGAISDDYPGSLLDVRHHVADDVHEVERALSLVEACGFAPPSDDDRRLAVRPEALRASRPAAVGDDRFVVVHPGATVPARTWPPERFEAAVAALARAGRRVVVTGATSERRLVHRVAAAADRAVAGSSVALPGCLALGELAALLSQADAVVVGNTGPAHLAAAVGTPVVSLFAPTVPAERWAPWGVPHVLLGDQSVPCAGCRARVCPFGTDQPCLSGVGVHEVVAAVETLSAAPSPGRGAVGVAS